MILFRQSDFTGGMDLELDAAKTPGNSYTLLVNARTRRDVISPTFKHNKLSGPETGTYQGLYVAGNLLILFCNGNAYYADITASPISFAPIALWTQMSTAVPRIYAEIVPVTSNFYNPVGDPDFMEVVFNGTIASFPQALFVFDGTAVNRPQAILADGSVRILQDYPAWTKNNPEYVPFGSLPAVVNNKLILASVDLTKIYHSVSGRVSDFVVNRTSAGEKGGDADTVAAAVSYNALTNLKPLSTGQILAQTLYGTWAIEMDYDHTIFNEPFLNPIFLFPVGVINDISSIDLLQQTAFITQSGIHSFNAVAQAKKESNNFPLGAKIRGLLENPQSDTCAGCHDDFGLFAVNTVHGYGVVVYDTIRQNFQSLDLSFGRVKQFANTRILGQERLFFITHDNEIYEAFAGDEKEIARVYLGEWTSGDASALVVLEGIDLIFSSVRTDGEVKITVYADREKVDEVVLPVTAAGFTNTYPLPLPFTEKLQVVPVSWQPGKQIRAWKLGFMVEWNFDGDLTDAAVNGNTNKAANAEMTVVEPTLSQEFAFIADSGPSNELNPGGAFPAAGFLSITVVDGSRYVYDANGNGALVNGNTHITSGIFTAKGTKVIVEGTGAATFTLRLMEDYGQVLDSINATDAVAIIGGGDHSYPSGTFLDNKVSALPLKLPFWPVAGNHEYDTLLGSNFFNKFGIPRFYTKSFDYVDFFFYNGGWTTANVPVDANGITIGATSEPSGNNAASLQAAWLRNELAASTKPFKFVVVHEPPYTMGNSYYPGYADLRLPFKSWGANGVLSGHSHASELIVVNGFPYFISGTGGRSLVGKKSGVTDIGSFFSAAQYGSLHMISDPLTCRFEFRDVDNNVLYSYAVYA